jgi:hypothetical protein
MSSVLVVGRELDSILPLPRVLYRAVTPDVDMMLIAV